MNTKYANFLINYSLLSSGIFIFVIFILGILTPGYDFMRDTISILAVMKYGFFQQINFIQFAVTLITSGYLIYTQLEKSFSKEMWRRIVLFCTIFIFIEIIFPTDFTGNTPILQSKITTAGFIHLSTLFVFFLLAPVGVYYLSRALREEPKFTKIANYTKLAGFLASFLCYVWTLLYFKGWLYDYLGIMQKVVVLIVISWFVILLYTARKTINSTGT